MKYLIYSLLIVVLCKCNNSSEVDLTKELAHVDSTDAAIKAETAKKDSLQKYSYFIHGFIKNDSSHPKSGTGFFIRSNNKLFLVTCSHVFGNFSLGMKDRPKDFPDTMNLRLPLKDGSGYEFIPIDITSFKKSHKFYSYQKADIVIYEVNLRKEYQIYSIENFIPQYDTLPTGPDLAVLYGFPQRNVPDIEHFRIINSVKSEGFVAAQFLNSIMNWSSGQQDSVNYLIKFPEDQQVGPGFSGSPTFLKYGDKIIFGGVCTMGPDEGHASFIVRPKFVRREIQLR